MTRNLLDEIRLDPGVDLDDALTRLLETVSKSCGYVVVLVSHTMPRIQWPTQVSAAAPSVTLAKFRLEQLRTEFSLRTDLAGADAARGDVNQHELLARDLQVSLSGYLNRQQTRWMEDVLYGIVQIELSPVESLRLIARSLRSVLPETALFQGADPDLIQILVANEEGNLRIEASTGEDAGAVVARNSSIVGHALQRVTASRARGLDASEQFFIYDPTDDVHEDLYKSFFQGATIRSELVVPFVMRVDESDRTVDCALNAESTKKLAFSRLHASFLKQIMDRLAPVLASTMASRDRLGRQRNHILRMQVEYLGTVGRMLQHDMGPSLNVLRSTSNSLRIISQRLSSIDGDPSIEVFADELTIAARNLDLAAMDGDSALDRYAIELEDHVRLANVPVRDLVTRARLAFLRQCVHAEWSEVTVSYEEVDGLDPIVRCTGLMEVFIFNIFINSLDWYKNSRSMDSQDRLRIIVNVREGVREWEDDERDLVSIEISDNGPGAETWVLDRLNAAVPASVSTRGGNGIALRTLREYVGGLGGWVVFGSDRGFRTQITLPNVAS